MINLQAPSRAAFWLKFAAWWAVPGTDLFVCAPAKCASMSLRKSLFGHARLTDALNYIQQAGLHCGPYSPWEVATMRGQKFLAVREPVDRFGSLWRDKCGRKSKSFMSMYGKTPNELMDAVESFPFGESHWLPINFYAVPGTEVVPYDRLISKVELPLVTTNTTDKTKSPAMPKKRILRHYAADAALYRRAEP